VAGTELAPLRSIAVNTTTQPGVVENVAGCEELNRGTIPHHTSHLYPQIQRAGFLMSDEREYSPLTGGCRGQMSIEEALIEVWRAVLRSRSKSVTFGDQIFIVKRTSRGLLQIDFVFDGIEIRGIEQNPNTKSRWAEMARSGEKVMQFLSEGRYFANVASGKVTVYRDRHSTSLKD
jgi:hypothetical protein